MACDDLEADPRFVVAKAVPALAVPEPTGSHRVGRQEFAWKDDARQRELRVWIYYPAATLDSIGEVALPDDDWSQLHRNELARQFGPAAAAALMRARYAAIRGAVIEPASSPRPVIIFAPGVGRLPTDYSSILVDLASHGSVVVTFAPPGDGGTVLLADGRVVLPVVPDEHMVERVADDFSFVRRRLAALEYDMSWPFRGTLDLARVGAAGHATGGAAAFLAARHDTLLRAAVNLDGDLSGEAPDHGAAQPLLYVSAQPADLDDIATEQWAAADRGERRRDDAWEAAASDSRNPLHARMRGMLRGNFFDAALLPASSLPTVLRNRRTGRINPARGLQLTAQLLDEFFAEVFVGTRRGLATLPVAFPELKLSR